MITTVQFPDHPATHDDGDAAMREFGFERVQINEREAPQPGRVAERLRGLVAELEQATGAGDLGRIVNGVAAVRRLVVALDAWVADRAALERAQVNNLHLDSYEILAAWHEEHGTGPMRLAEFEGLLRTDRRLACLLLATACVDVWRQDGVREIARVVGLFMERDVKDDVLLRELAMNNELIVEDDCPWSAPVKRASASDASG